MKHLALFALLLCTSIAMAEPQVKIVPEEQKIERGEAVAVDIELHEFPVTEGGGISLRFDPDVLRATGVVFTGAWSFATDTGVIDNDEGRIRDIVFSAFPGISGNRIPVATVWFEALKKGKSKLKMSKSSKNPFASGGEEIDVEFENGKIKVKRLKHSHHKHDHEKHDRHNNKKRDRHDDD